MKTILYIFNAFLLSGFISNLTAQEVENPQEELIENEWYLKKVVSANEDYYFMADDYIEQAVLEAHFLDENNSDDLFMEANFCESVATAFIFISENEFLTQLMPFGILVKNNDWSGNCDISAPPLSEDEFFVTEALYCYDFWNNNMMESDHHPDYPYHYFFEIEETDSFKTLVLINDSGVEAHYQNVPFMSVDQNELSHLNIYPNPVQESFQIENLSEKSNLKIYDLSGKEIFNQSIHSSTENIDVSQLSSGLYFYGIFQEGRRVKTGKLVKE